METEDDISKLLKLKRYEQPPPAYFDEFLRDFQARQRADLIRHPLWEIVWDRIFSKVSTFHVPRLAYVSIVALALAVSTFILARPTISNNPIADSKLFRASSPSPVAIKEPLRSVMASTGSPSVHYVLPTRPVSYASSRSF